jgi:hypothetical protein
MDSASPRVSEAIRRLMGQKKIMIILFPVRTVNIFQAFDLVFFVAIKRIQQTATGEFGHAFAGESITKLLQVGKQMLT